MKFKSFIKPESIFDNHPDAVIIINYQKNIVFWNARAQDMFGYSKREVLGKNLSIVLPDAIDKIYQSLTSKKNVVLSGTTSFGKELYVDITCCEIEENDKVILAARDVTRTHNMVGNILSEYEKTKTLSQNKNGFIASLSHELRTPMHSIIGFSQALLDGLGGDLSEKQEKYISIISRNANSLLGLLNSILDLSKIEAGKMEYNIKTFDIAQVINLVVETISPQAEEKKVSFETDLTDLIKRNAYSDENMVRQVLLNILNNAIKFTDSGSIKLKVAHPDLDFVRYQGIDVPEEFNDNSYLMFSVADTGIGIHEDDLNNIFDEYRQIDRAAAKKHGGSGLGLAITRKILEELGGIIWVESEVSQGSTFSFIIPIDKAPVKKEEEEQAEEEEKENKDEEVI